MSEASQALKARTENFAVAVVKFCETLPNTIAGRKIAGKWKIGRTWQIVEFPN